MLTGRCQCGRLVYQISVPAAHATLCHCRACQRTSGAPMVAWFTVATAGFHWLQGTVSFYASSAEGRRGFCGHCGSLLVFSHQQRSHELDVTLCSLDQPDALAPLHHTYTETQRSWLSGAATLPRYPGAEPDVVEDHC